MQIPYLNQILLLLVVTILTTLLTLAGIQVIHILREVKETVKKTNKMLEDFQLITSSIARPVAGISGFITGLKSGTDLVNFFLKGQSGQKTLEVKKDGE
jgi:hypothetical protein